MAEPSKKARGYGQSLLAKPPPVKAMAEHAKAVTVPESKAMPKPAQGVPMKAANSKAASASKATTKPAQGVPKQRNCPPPTHLTLGSMMVKEPNHPPPAHLMLGSIMVKEPNQHPPEHLLTGLRADDDDDGDDSWGDWKAMEPEAIREEPEAIPEAEACPVVWHDLDDDVHDWEEWKALEPEAFHESEAWHDEAWHAADDGDAKV